MSAAVGSGGSGAGVGGGAGFGRTRLAPTPSGFLHLGNVLSFAITAALARNTGARILLRIDDLDRERVVPDYVQDIFDSLRYMEIPWDEGPRDYEEFEREYSQVHRMSLYRKALELLRESGEVFACECSRAEIARVARRGEAPEGLRSDVRAKEGDAGLFAEEAYPGTCGSKGISLDRESVSWRLRTDPVKEMMCTDLSGTITKAAVPPSMKDFIIRKKDGHPAYQLASVVDDDYFGIDLVVRGNDLWPSTLAQLYLSQFLPESHFAASQFHHHGLLLAPSALSAKEDRPGIGDATKERKLSKSAGATSVRYLRQQGQTREAIYMLIAQMLGCGNGRPVRNFEELAEAAGGGGMF